MKLSDLSAITEIELDPGIKKRGLDHADVMELYYRRAARSHKIEAEPFTHNREFNVAIARNVDGRGSIEVFLLDQQKQNRVALYILLHTYSSAGYQVASTKVRPMYQGQGLALKVYRYLVVDLDLMLVSGALQSPGGAKLWLQLYKASGITVYGYDPVSPSNKFFLVEPDESGRLDSLVDTDVYQTKDSTSRSASRAIRLIAVSE